MSRTLEELDRILAETAEADDVLRRAVEAVAGVPGVEWAGIAFVEDDALVLGPTAGEADETRRTRVPIVFGGSPVGELAADGDADTALLESVAERLAPLVLVGWDTGGERWNP